MPIVKKSNVSELYQPSTLALENEKLNKDYSNTTPAVSDIEFNNGSLGIILIDRSDSTKKYRLYVDNGNLGIEEV